MLVFCICSNAALGSLLHAKHPQSHWLSGRHMKADSYPSHCCCSSHCCCCRGVLKPQKLLSYADGGMPYSKSVNEAGQQQPAAAKPSSTVSTAAAAAGGAQVVRPDGFQSCMAVRFRNMKWDGATGKVYR